MVICYLKNMKHPPQHLTFLHDMQYLISKSKIINVIINIQWH